MLHQRKVYIARKRCTSDVGRWRRHAIAIYCNGLSRKLCVGEQLYRRLAGCDILGWRSRSWMKFNHLAGRTLHIRRTTFDKCLVHLFEGSSLIALRVNARNVKWFCGTKCQARAESSNSPSMTNNSEMCVPLLQHLYW